jgi:hypothetical protein
VESFNTSWFKGFEVVAKKGSPKSPSREVILVFGCSEGMWQRSVYFIGEVFRREVCVE